MLLVGLHAEHIHSYAVTGQEATFCAQALGAVAYLEASSAQLRNVAEIFLEATRAAIGYPAAPLSIGGQKRKASAREQRQEYFRTVMCHLH